MVFFHGEPTWSYLWRKVIPPVRDAGYRCIAPDYAGFGRSDKPIDFDWYTYDHHTAQPGSLLEDLDLQDVTAVVHDWGGPIGLRFAAENPDRDLADGDHGDGPVHRRAADVRRLVDFRDFVERTEDLPISMLVRTPSPAAWKMTWSPPTTRRSRPRSRRPARGPSR